MMLTGFQPAPEKESPLWLKANIERMTRELDGLEIARSLIDAQINDTRMSIANMAMELVRRASDEQKP